MNAWAMTQWAQVSRFLETGGALMIPLLGLGVGLWYALVMRWFTLRSGWAGSMGELVAAQTLPDDGVLVRTLQRARAALDIHDSRLHLRGVIASARRQLRDYARLINAITLAAPMLGLLGTVIGMAQTFDALTAYSQLEQAERIAAGISQALVTTELGLFISIPGILLGRTLDRRAQRLTTKLDELEALLWSQRGGTP